jgi:hypothetical protein
VAGVSGRNRPSTTIKITTKGGALRKPQQAVTLGDIGHGLGNGDTGFGQKIHQLPDVFLITAPDGTSGRQFFFCPGLEIWFNLV